jgi:hypothetical protein
MVPPVSADAVHLINYCLRGQAQTCFCTSRLGLPQKEDNKKTRGSVVFKGTLAPTCERLYMSIREKRKELKVEFKTKEQLRDAALNRRHALIPEVTETLLAKYGATIWNALPPFATVICASHYPRHLRYTESSDRKRLVTPDLTYHLSADPK